jgi:hypothetical protein
LLAHHAQLVLHAGPHAPLIHGGDPLEVLDRLVGGIRRRHLDAGIVEGHIEPTVLCDRAVDHRCNLCLVRNVAGNADRGTALDADPLSLSRGEVAVEIRQHDGGAALGEHARRRQAHAFRGTRDQRHLPFEIVDRVHLKFTSRCIIAKT